MQVLRAPLIQKEQGSFLGTGIGGIETLSNEYANFLKQGPSRVSPFFVPMMIPNMAAGHVSIDPRT